MAILHKKLKRLKQVLKSFNKIHYGDLTLKVAAKRKELDAAQLAMLSNPPNAEVIDHEKTLSVELHELMRVEESFFRQKSRIQWI